MKPFLQPCDTAVRSGYTYVELVLAIAVSIILTAAAIPSYNSALLYARVDAASNRIAADIAYAQRQAMVRSASQSIQFFVSVSALTPNSYSMPTVQYVNFAAAGNSVNLAQDPYNAILVSVSFGAGTTLTFNQFGAPSAGGTIVVSAGAYSKTITVDATTGKTTIS